jgi:divalent metal cation (Fe/Co/Zn/Cd) transporter
MGLVGVAVGWRWADGVAGLAITGFIVRVGCEVTGELISHLMDGVDPDVLTMAERAAAVPGVHHAHVRARWTGRSLVVEVEAFVDADATVAEAEATGRRVEDAVAAAVPEARAVMWSPRAMPAP